MSEEENIEKYIDNLIGKGPIDRALAYEYLKRGIGVYRLGENDILHIQGYRFVEVKEFVKWEEPNKTNGNPNRNTGYIDVHFIQGFKKDKRDGNNCHFEFQVKCTGHGGTPIKPFKLKGGKIVPDIGAEEEE